MAGREHQTEDSAHLSPSITIEEWRVSSTKLSLTAVLSADSASCSVSRQGAWWSELRRRIFEAFVPEGYPGSVTPDYLPFQIWDSLQGLSTYIRSMLATQALLTAFGVGEKSASVLGATFQWFLKDFTGMLGGILFTFYQGSNLDSNAKMWRLVADFMNDIGMLMDLISPMFPSALVVIICLGSISRSFTGVASGATRAALTQHFSLQNNAADISAKEGSQETLATMFGMGLGIIVAQVTEGKPLVIWLSFLLLTMFHMYANYRAVRCLSLITLNNARCCMLLLNYMETGKVLSPHQISSMEHVLPSWIGLPTSKKEYLHQYVHLGVKISSLKHSSMTVMLGSSISNYKKENYLLLERNGVILVTIHKDASPADILRSFVHAIVLRNFTGKAQSPHVEANLWMDGHYQVLIKQLRSSGWMTERLLSPSIVWRAQWISDTSKSNLKLS